MFEFCVATFPEKNNVCFLVLFKYITLLEKCVLQISEQRLHITHLETFLFYSYLCILLKIKLSLAIIILWPPLLCWSYLTAKNWYQLFEVMHPSKDQLVLSHQWNCASAKEEFSNSITVLSRKRRECSRRI